MAAHNIECLDLAGPSSKREAGMERVSAIMMEASASAAVFGFISRNPDRDIVASADKLVRLGFATVSSGAGSKGNRKL
jgi:hypothetical protein